MRELKIRPIMKNGEKAVAFNPDEDNRKLDAKVPVLLINATTLNTGHNWRFEAIRMGEPPRANAREKEIDKNIRLRRPKRYEDLPEDLQDTWLGDAVAASACVPGIFPPLAIRGLYEWDKSHKVNGTNKESVVVQLVDGGVHDNQGLEALWDRECERIIVSDASGQLDDDPDPGNRALAALIRSSSISMDRVREEQLFRAFEQKKKHNKPLAFIHLRQGLSAEAIPWIGDTECPEKKVKSESKLPGRQEYKVDPKVQELLSRVRTDLDSFTEVEAYSLMADGYLLSDDELPRVGGKRGEENNASGKKNRPWKFLAVEDRLHRPPEKVYFRHLKVASENLFKPFRLSWKLTTVTLLLPLIMLYFGGRWAWSLLLPELSRSIAIGNLLLAGFLFLFSLAVGILVPWLARVFKPLQILRSPNEFISRLVVRGLLPALGAVLVRIYLRTVDRLFLELGRVSR